MSVLVTYVTIVDGTQYTFFPGHFQSCIGKGMDGVWVSEVLHLLALQWGGCKESFYANPKNFPHGRLMLAAVAACRSMLKTSLRFRYQIFVRSVSTLTLLELF